MCVRVCTTLYLYVDIACFFPICLFVSGFKICVFVCVCVCMSMALLLQAIAVFAARVTTPLSKACGSMVTFTAAGIDGGSHGSSSIWLSGCGGQV